MWAVINYDRDRAFSVDAMNNEKMDVYRFAEYTEKSGITVKFEALTAGNGVCSAITTANNILDEAEVDALQRHYCP